MPHSKPTNIILADDHALIREALRPYLRLLAEGLEVLEAGTYAEAVGRKAELEGKQVAIALVDLQMPDISEEDPFSSVRNICGQLKNTAVVIFSGSDDAETIGQALRCGARGFIPKSTPGRSIVNILRLVLSGERYIPPSVLEHVLPADKRPGEDNLRPMNHPPGTLSDREEESLRLLLKDMTNKEIARELAVQGGTVKLHLRNAYRKIGASNRIDAVRIAIERGFLNDADESVRQ